MAAIQAISSLESQNSTIAEIRTLVHNIQRNCEVMFQWIPPHCDLPGNDKADELAKAGASMKQLVIKIPLHTVKAYLAASVKARSIESKEAHLNFAPRHVSSSNVIVPASPSDGERNSRGMKNNEYNNAFLYFFTPLLLCAPSRGGAGTITSVPGA
jgi:hypothetical protein